MSVHNLRPANDAEALARSVLNGDPIVPSEIVEDGQKFIDARGPEKDPEIQLEQPPPEDDYEPSLAPSLPALEDLDAPPVQDASAVILQMNLSPLRRTKKTETKRRKRVLE